MVIQLVFDRTEADVLIGNKKGHYGPEDLNRVESAVAELQEMIKQLDMYPELTVKTDWTAPGTFSADSWPVESQVQRYLENVKILSRALGLSPALPERMHRLDWQGANQIEYALQQVYARVQSILKTYEYSGERFAGEEKYL